MRFYRVDGRPAEKILEGPHTSEPIPAAELDCPYCYGEDEECELCEGEGFVYYDPENEEHAEIWKRQGISAFMDEKELINYFEFGNIVHEKDITQVVEIEGEEVDIGPDGESLIVPKEIKKIYTWGEFKKEVV